MKCRWSAETKSRAHGRARRAGHRDRAGNRSPHPGHSAGPAPEGRGRLPLHHPASLRLAREVDQRRRRRARGAADHHARRPKRRAERDAGPRGSPCRRHGRGDHADAETSGRPHPPARAGAQPRPDRRRPRRRALPEGQDHEARGKRAARRAAARARSSRAQREAEPRKVGLARQEHLARGHGHRGESGRPGPAGRSGRLESRLEARRSPEDPRVHGPAGTAAPRQRESLERDHRSDDAAGDLHTGARRDGQVAARVLPAPAASSDSAGARRGRGDVRGAGPVSQARRR